MPPRLILFDFDGTLADSFPWFVGMFDQMADEFGFRKIDAAERETLRTQGSREIIRRLGVRTWTVPRIARRMRVLKLAAADRIPLFDGTAPLLQALSERGTRLAIVSSDSEASVRLTLGALADRIEFYECGASLFGKRARLRKALRRAGVAAQDAVYVGDELRDADAAKQAGLRFIAVAWGYTNPTAFNGYRIVATMDELLQDSILP